MSELPCALGDTRNDCGYLYPFSDIDIALIKMLSVIDVNIQKLLQALQECLINFSTCVLH